VLCPKHQYLEAILRDNRDWVAFLGDRATEFLDRIVVKLTEGLKVGDLLVVVECGCGTLSKGKNSLEHRDGVCANVCVKVIRAFIFVVIVEEVSVIVIVVVDVVVCARWWVFEVIRRSGSCGTSWYGLSCTGHDTNRWQSCIWLRGRQVAILFRSILREVVAVVVVAGCGQGSVRVKS
jgi:hypothetical protein